MKISKVKMRGFGKFKDAEFSFQKGLNVIYGPNESGKTTLSNFILYVLSGFSSEEVERYRPWDGDEFGGEIIVETSEGERNLALDPSDPSLERVLRREEYESTSYIPESSGMEVLEGVSGMLIARLRKRMEEIKSVGRIIDLLRREQELYEKMADEERELAEKLGEVEARYEELLRKLEEEKTLRKRYVSLKRRLKELEGDLERLEKELLAARVERAREIWEKMDELRIRISSLGAEISDLKKYTKYPQERIERVWKIRDELNGIEEKLSKLKRELGKREEERKILTERKKILEEILRVEEDEDVDKVILKIKNLELSLRMLEEKKRPKGYDERWSYFEKIFNVEERISELERNIEKLEKFQADLEELEKELEIVERDLSTLKAKINLRNTLTVVFLALAGGVMAAGYLSNMLFIFSIAAAVSTGLSIALLLSTGELRKARANAEGEKERLQMSYKVLEKKIDSLKEELRQAVSGTDFSSAREMVEEYRRYVRWKDRMKSHAESEDVKVLEREIVESLREFFGEITGDYRKLVEELKEKASEYAIIKDKIASLSLSIDGLRTVIEDLERRREELEREREELFEELGCGDYEGCERLVENRKKYEELVKEREKAEEKLKELKEEWEVYKSFHGMEIPDGVDVEKLDSVEAIQTRMENVRLEISEVESRIGEVMREIDDAKVDSLELKSVRSEREKLRLMKRMLESELKVFPEVVGLLSRIKDEFVEKYKEVFEESFKRYASRIIGKEFEFDIKDDLSVEIKTKGGKMSLSGATRDQLELSYKLALYETLNPEDPYPLVIDNALTRYDDERLKGAITLLKEIAKERQVILTTSDARVLKLVPKKSVKELQVS